VNYQTILGLVLSNALIGFSGGLFCQYQGFADISQGQGTLIIALAAVIIGEKLLPFRSMWAAVFSCILGSIIYRIFIALALHSDFFGIQTQDLNFITGIMVISIMCLKMRKREEKIIC
jgi:putative ABC transport system permease protein